MDDKTDHILRYLANVTSANNETAKKELLKGLLIRLFAEDADAQKIIDKMSLGAERTIFNIALPNRTKTGWADTQYNQVIIEFETDLNRTGEHAKDQLIEYLVGNWNSGQDYNFTLIASDCVTWKIYAPDYESLLGKRSLTVQDIILKEVDSFELSETNATEFYFFLDHYLFRITKIKASSDNIQHDFGETSATFLTCIPIMKDHFDKVKGGGEVQVAFEEWRKFLSIAYGSFSGSQEVFLVHAYLSIFSKILAYMVISHDSYIDDKEMRGIVNGDVFKKFNIQNFVQEDFYHWVSTADNFTAFKPVFRKIVQQISHFDFKKVDEDVLKGVYQELIDLETRHSLGEYYTPDWLCEKMIEEYEFLKDSYILDPACGSGSFLRAVISKLKNQFTDLTAEQVVNQVNGIDIHPLSVQIAKTTVLLALGKNLLGKAKSPVQLKVFLANTLFAPEGTIDLFGDEYKLAIDKKTYPVSTKVFEDANLFDIGVSVCDDLAEISKNGDNEPKEVLERNLVKRYKKVSLNVHVIESFYKIYLGIKHAKETDRDSIWKFILQNSYKPFFLQQKFDFVFGNPPWLTYADITNSDYQERIGKLADKYNIKPKNAANFPHLEIAAIFLSHSASYFLKKNGSLAFVLPRAFLTADHHDNTRSGKAKGFLINQIWDLKDVSPLFRVPSCVFFIKQKLQSEDKKKDKKEDIYAKGIKGFVVKAKLPFTNGSLREAKNHLSLTEVKWHYSKLKERSAFTINEVSVSNNISYYDKYFRQGATIVPRNFYFIEISQEFDGDLKDRYLQVKTSEESKAEAKPPWKKITMEGSVHSSFLFRTAISKNIIPFGLINPPLIVLPIVIDFNEEIKRKQIRLLDWQEIKNLGYTETANWFKRVDSYWNKYKTENNKDMTSIGWLNYQNKLTYQDLNKKYLILYTASAKNANAVVLDRKDFDLEFIVESKAYVYYTDNLREAHYLTACINSNVANKMIKEFQSRGLFGPRDVHKKILEVGFPKFDPNNNLHIELSELGLNCNKKSKEFIQTGLSAEKYRVGNVRTNFLKSIESEMASIDAIVTELLK